MGDALRGVDDWLGLDVVVLGQAFDLLHVEDGVSLHKRYGAIFLRAVVLLFGLGDSVGIDNRIAALALPDMSAQLLRLAVGHPVRGAIARFHRRAPQHQDVDAAIG